MNRRSLYFHGDRTLEIREEPIPTPAPDEILVQAISSSISPGTEQLVYQGRVAPEMKVDSAIKVLNGTFSYPLKYGYALVGEIVEAGSGVDKSLLGTRVFCLHPHESHFTTLPDTTVPLPEHLPTEDAVFLATMETAVNLVMDGRPVIGECAAIFGQGIVGLLVTALLHRFPLALLITLDRYPRRRQLSLEAGADHSLDPDDEDLIKAINTLVQSHSNHPGTDLTYEISGAPEALNTAISLTGFEGRIVVGSWYGTKTAALDLGGTFHRSRIRIFSSQVSSIHSRFTGRWDKQRRMQVALDLIDALRPSKYLTHSFPLEEAETAFTRQAEHPEDTLQIALTY